MVFLGVLAVGLLVAYRLISGRSMGLKETARIAFRTGMGVLRRGEVQASTRGEYTNVFFLHHSVGNNLINQGNLREQFQQAGIDFWDQGYRYDGMRGPDGQDTGFWYPVPGDNTDPDGLARVFAQQPRRLPVNALSGLLQHEVIIFKSCYPNSSINGPEQLASLQQMYLGMRATIEQHPDRIFILLTTPPLNPAETQLEQARYARALSEWMLSDEFVGDLENLYVFDFYSLLAENDPASAEYGMLRAAYRNGADSHPNAAANQAIAPVLVDFVLTSIQAYRDGS
jgi:hypothetical protein